MRTISRESFHSQQRKTCKSPAYLYQRGNVYYFRHVFSDALQKRLQHKELRLSLSTGFLRQAKRLAGKLRIYLEEIMAADNGLKNYHEIRAKLVAQLTRLLESCEEKRPLSLPVIRDRMDRMLQLMLKTADEAFYSPPTGILFEEGQPVTVSSAEALDHQYQIFLKNQVNKPLQLSVEEYPEALLELLHAKFFIPEELTEENIKHILNEYIKMQIIFNRIMAARERGDYAYERQFSRIVSEPCAQAVPQAEAQSEILLSDFIRQYTETKIRDKQWKIHSVPDHENRLNNLMDILGNKPVAEITRDDMRRYRDILSKLPPGRKKNPQFRNLTVREILALQPRTVLNTKTVNIIVEAAASMFEWGIREGILSVNPAKALQIRDDRQEITLREAFSQEDLAKLFFSGTYVQTAFKYPSHYWAPLIALYSGMRLEEICQLHCADIVQEDGIWCFDVNAKPSADGVVRKLVKTKNAVRIVPVHHELIRLGFIAYIQEIRNSGYERVFPELNKTDKSPKYGKQVGKNFSRFVKDQGIEGNKSFHSLRHTFSDYFKKRNLHNDVFKQVFGHDIEALATRQYGSKFSATQCYTDVISQLTYDGEVS